MDQIILIECRKCGDTFVKPKSKRRLCTGCYKVYRDKLNRNYQRKLSGRKPKRELTSQQQWYRLWNQHLKVQW